MKRLLQSIIRRLGYDIVRYDFAPDITEEQRQIFSRSRPYTLTSFERMAALSSAVEHVVRNRIPGDIVECGVWRGGSMMLSALTLTHLKDESRDLYLFDTYTGMPIPTQKDVSHDGILAQVQMDEDPRKSDVGCLAELSDVKNNLYSTGYPRNRIHFIEGRVEDTIPASAPAQIALLRLDTDWYESTKHELEQLYPRLAKGGIMIIDDYGHWQGARKAVDEYFQKREEAVYLHRIDYTGRLLLKT